MTQTAGNAGGPASLTLKASFAYWSQDQVRWSDTDRIGHANHLSVAAYVETGRALLMREFLNDAAPESLVVVTAQLLVNYHGESHWPDTIDIGTGILSIGNSSFRIGSGVFHGERCIASAETALVLIDGDTRKARPLPSWLRDWMQAHMISPG